MRKLYFLTLFVFLAQLLVAQVDCSTISGNITPATAEFCEGGSAVLTANGGTSYEWRLDNVVIPGETGSTITATQAGTYSVIIKEDVCEVPASNTTQVTVNPNPSGAISPGTGAICVGGSLVLTASGGTSYTWFLNGAEIAGETGSTITASQAGLYSAIIHQGDCSAPASNTSLVTLLLIPVGTISPATGNVCTGGTLNLTATGGTSYTWFRNGSEIAGETDAILAVTQDGIYSAIINQGTCSGPALNTAIISETTPPTGSISPATGSVCTGNPETLTATGGTSYTWFRNGNQINGVTDATLDVTQSGTYSVIINNGSCSAPASNEAIITTEPGPTGTISPSSGSICAGGSIVLTATGGSSYAWFRNGNAINGVTDATLDVSQSGTYSVIINNGTCTAPASNTSVVTVAAAPSGSISPANAAICPGGSQVLTVSGGDSYTWFLDGVEITGETNATITVSQAGLYTAIIKQGDCTGPASNASVVTAVPTPVGTITPAAGSICENGSLTLTASGGTTYTWFKDGNEISGETDATLNVTDPGIYFAIIRQGSCSGPALNTSVITLASTPTGNISPATGSICAGGTLELTATGGTSYTWFRNGNAISGQTGATLNVTQAGTYTATIRQGNCNGPAANNSVVTLATAPTGTITPATGSFCEGGSTTLTATGGSSYKWFRNGAEIAGSTGATLNVTLAGTYTATINQGNCSGPATNSSVITVAAAPTGTITPAAVAICGGDSHVLTATGGTSYAWSRDGVVINGEQSATLTVTQPGTYSVVIKNGDCTGAASNTSVVTSDNVGGMRYADVSARPNVPVQLQARDIGTAYEWIPVTDLSDPTSRTPTAITRTDREYVIRITTAGGCFILDTVQIKVKSILFVPTAFSPDGNGVNDLLRPLGEIRSIEYFKIFNRWGQLMFDTKAIGAGWDGKFKGKEQPSDTYTWLLSGTFEDGEAIKISGKTLLIR